MLSLEGQPTRPHHRATKRPRYRDEQEKHKSDITGGELQISLATVIVLIFFCY
jgi:hypothetical protein